MASITCKDCGKVWLTKQDFDNDPGCDRGWCRQPGGKATFLEVNEMSRRRGREGNRTPAHIQSIKDKRDKRVAEAAQTAEEVIDKAKAVTPKIHTHETTSRVLSTWEKGKPTEDLHIHDVININIFVRK